MSYTALYRKFRPLEFEDVKGQEHIVTTLKNQVKADRIGHAYLFCGTRGTGKTTIAKILAKAVNCENPKDGSPCNECSVCQSINRQTSMNVIEIDAASNNGVDNIREIVDEVQYSPTEGKYKVYIIDEVHMLSTGAFNALLKTLEEPPSYVIFILATTEAHKIPVTILSRCQRYDFRRITVDVIADRIKELLEIEQVEAEEKAVRFIAKAADGAMRDGLSLLDQCIAFYLGEKLTYDKVLDVLGAVDTEVFGRLISYIAAGEVVPVMELLEEMVIAGRELTQFITDFTWYMRNLLLLKTSEKSEDMIDVSQEQLGILREKAGLMDGDTIIRYIRILAELSNQLRYSTQKRVLIEISMIKMCRPAMETNYDSILDRIRQIEKQLKNGVTAPKANSPDTSPEPLPASLQAKESANILKAVPEDLQVIAKNWPSILSMLPSALRSMMNTARPSAGEDNTLLILFTDEMEKEYVGREGHIADIEGVIKDYLQKEVKVQVRYINEGHESADNFVDLTKIINMKIDYED